MKIEADIGELVELVGSVTEAYTTAFFLADNQRQTLKLWRFYSLSNNVIKDATIPFGVGPIGWVAENLKPFDLSKFSERDSGLLRLYSKNEQIKSFFAVPVMRDGILEGVLCIDSKRSFVFASKDQKVLSLFAKQFAHLVNNMRLKNFVDVEVSDVTFLHDFCRKIASAGDVDSILRLTFDSIVKMVNCDDHFLCLKVDGEATAPSLRPQFRVELAASAQNVKSVVFSDQDGLAGCVIRGKKPFLLANRKEDAAQASSDVFVPSKSEVLSSASFRRREKTTRVKSFLGVPLLTKDDVLGLICLIDSDEGSFNQRDLRVVSIISDNASVAIANVKAQEQALRLSTVVDGLTGLYNFTGFQQCLEAAFQEADRRRRPLSLIIVDIDNFKDLNTRLGYKVGDEVLKGLAQVLLDLSKNSGTATGIPAAARFGSDEFALILPSTGMEEAISIAEKVRKAVVNPTFIAPSHSAHISISVGASSFPRNSGSCNDLVNNALHALQGKGIRAKGIGNRE